MTGSVLGIEIDDDARHDILRILTLWAEARARFGKGGPFLFGAFTAADAMYAPVVLRFRTYDVAVSNKAYYDAMLQREQTVSTYMGNELAIPHGTNEAKESIKRSALSVIRYDQLLRVATTRFALVALPDAVSSSSPRAARRPSGCAKPGSATRPCRSLMPRNRSLNIDDPFDFEIAEFIYSRPQT